MANTKQATKRARQAESHRVHNMSLRSAMRTMIKRTLSLIKAGNKEEAMASLRKTSAKLDRMAGQNHIHANKAARLKSRLNAKVKQL